MNDKKKHNLGNAAYYHFASCPGKKAVEDFREQLEVAKKNAELIARITPELEKAFVEVFI